MTTTTLATWVDEQNGRIVCDRHRGMYLTAACEARPRARRHITPLGVWHRIDDTVRAAFAEDGLGPVTCEDCTFGGGV